MKKKSSFILIACLFAGGLYFWTSSSGNSKPENREKNPSNGRVPAEKLPTNPALFHATTVLAEDPSRLYMEELQRALQEKNQTNLQIALQNLAEYLKESPEHTVKIFIDNPLVAQDAKDYLEILQTGVTDPDEIHRQKSWRDAQRKTRPVIR